MTRTQLAEIAAWRSSPLSSKTMWTIYVGQLSLAAIAAQTIAVLGANAPAWLLAVYASWSALLAITGVAGLSWTDPAVSIARVLKGSEPPASPPGGAS